MRLTNFLLIVLIGLVAFQKLPGKQAKSLQQREAGPTITIGKKETKSITPTVKNENPVKHSTTFRNYMDSDGRVTLGISHNIRIGKAYYISGGVTARESSSMSDTKERDVGVNLSVTKYW
jgi:hypothetical protein